MANLRVPGVIARDVNGADVVVALKATFRKDPARLGEARSRGMGTFVVKSNTYIQIENIVRMIFGLEPTMGSNEEEVALDETTDAIDRVKETGEGVELAPQNSYMRRLQHQLVERADLGSESLGDEPNRRLKILPK
jgi:hypothetical protein